MSQDKFNNIIDTAKKLVLSKEEKQSMRLHLMSVMRANPVKRQMAGFGIFGVLLHRPVMAYSFLVSLLVIFGVGSISVAANKSLPGELLYPVKTQVNERVLGFITVDENKKAEYELGLVQLRLEEIEKVTSENKLNDAKTSQVTALLNEHINNVKERVGRINNENNPEVALELNSELESSLSAHTRVLDTLAQHKTEGISTMFKGLVNNLKNTGDETTKQRQQQELNLSQEFSKEVNRKTEKKFAQAQALLKDVKDILGNKKADITTVTFTKAAFDINTIEQAIAEAKNTLDAKDYDTSFIMLQNAIRMLKEEKIYISNEAKLKIDLEIPIIKMQKKGSLFNSIKPSNSDMFR